MFVIEILDTWPTLLEHDNIAELSRRFQRSIKYQHREPSLWVLWCRHVVEHCVEIACPSEMTGVGVTKPVSTCVDCPTRLPGKVAESACPEMVRRYQKYRRGL